MQHIAILKNGIPTFKEKKYGINSEQLDRIIAILLETERRYCNTNVSNIMPAITLHNLAVEIEDLRRLRNNPN